MFNRDYILKGIFCTIALALTASTNSFACSTAQWDDSSGGLAGSPELVSRYSELCAFEITDGSYVASTKAADSRYIARFYVLDGLSGSGNVEIFEA
ncbi:MAG: hypothetical protein KJN69_05985, partial [Gammaproteobacteria bacterium]|nr:hypothetical protein [Gammaproteobacteria bacterium]